MKNEKSVKTTSKKALHRFAAAASVLLAVCLVFMMPVSAETHTDHADWTELTSSTTITSGKYYLNNDLELSSSLTIPEDAQVTLCLNGKTLKAADSASISIITVSKGAVLNLTDCSENNAGKITGGKGTEITPSSGYTAGGGIYVKGGTLNMYGGNITSCDATFVGGGVFVSDSEFPSSLAGTATSSQKGTFNMSGGCIAECNAKVYGGGVYIFNSGSFNMYDGSIINCKSSDGSGGGVSADKNCEVTMSGGIIKGCISTNYGGGVFVQDSKFTMTGTAKIEDCKINGNTGSGGGVSVVTSNGATASFMMEGGEITGCEAAGSGGVELYGVGSTSFTMTSGKITECKSTVFKNQGGVTSNGGTITMTGGEITNCQDKDGTDSAVRTNKDLTIYGDAKVDGVSLKSNSVITIPDGQTFSGTISGITSSSTDENKELINGEIGNTASITATITWKNDDGTVLETNKNVARGTTPEYNGDTPTKGADAQYTYTFSGWTPQISVVSINAVYTATYTTTVNKYTITWKNYDGSVLKTDSVEYGTTPTYGGDTPTKPSDAQNAYVFNGWTTGVVAVTGDASYIANFTATDLPPVPSSSSSSSKGSDSGNYQYFPREVTADGIISFGSSKVVKGMELPAGSFGRVTLNTMPDFEMPENGFYAFEIDAPGYNLDAKINGGLSFQIKAADLEEEGWTAEDIVLFHGTVAEDGTITWEALPTSLVEVENGIAYYKAVINGCSPFYIGFVEDGSIVNEPVVEPSDEPTDVPQDVPGEDLPDIPGVQDEPEEPSTPAPILAVLAGLGAAVVLRRK